MDVPDIETLRKLWNWFLGLSTKCKVIIALIVIGGLCVYTWYLKGELARYKADNAELRRENLDLRLSLDPLRRDVYRPLSPQLRNRLVSDLRSLRSRYRYLDLEVEIVTQLGSRNRNELALELVELLRSAEFDAKTAGDYWPGVKILPDVAISFHSEDSQFTEDFVSILQMFINSKFTEKETKVGVRGTLLIEISGDPFFSPDGVVSFP